MSLHGSMSVGMNNSNQYAAQGEQPNTRDCHKRIERVCIVDAIPGMGGPHRVLYGKCHQTKQDRCRATCHSIGFAITFFEVRTLPDERDAQK